MNKWDWIWTSGGGTSQNSRMTSTLEKNYSWVRRKKTKEHILVSEFLGSGKSVWLVDIWNSELRVFWK